MLSGRELPAEESTEPSQSSGPEGMLRCPSATTLASGPPERSLFSAAASKGIRALWCERYDEYARTVRVGPYLELYPSGALRTDANFHEGRLHGPLTLYHENGQLWLRSAYTHGVEGGSLEIFHPSGALWLEGKLEQGALHGPLRSYFPDGSLESETRFEHGREQGLARSFYPTAAGGRLRSETRVETDRVVGEHRLLDPGGRLIGGVDPDPIPAAPSLPPRPGQRRGGPASKR